MKTIQLTQNKTALVDDEDFKWLNQWKWYAAKDHKYDRWYAKRHNKNGTTQMHCLIMNTPKDLMTDHINHDGIDNRRCNLRICSNSQNQCNRNLTIKKTSKYKGVYWNIANKKWHSQIVNKSKKEYIGIFDSETDAAKAYDAKAKELFGKYAYLNFV